MARKSKKSNQSKRGGNTAKKNSPVMLESGGANGGALQWVTKIYNAWRLYDLVKSWLEQSDLFS